MTTAPPPSTFKPLYWDIFCRVIDNFGDLGVCWRLSADLASRGHRVRLWVDDASALQWMAPGALQGHWLGVQVLRWEQSQDTQGLQNLAPADVWIEGFGCEVAPEFIAAPALSMASNAQNGKNVPIWINLEYLSAEPYVQRAHGLPSPVQQGPGSGRTKHFFYPGFTAGTGGLLRESGQPEEQQHLMDIATKRKWLAEHAVTWHDEVLVSLFCYEPAPLVALLREWAVQTRSTRLLVTAGRATLAVQAALAMMEPLPADSALRINYLSALNQTEFDQLLACCDLNFVRGEDSLVRAIWAGKPLVWHIYPQDDGAHHAKLMAFLDRLNAPPSLVQFHARWNGINASQQAANYPELLPADLSDWRSCVQDLRDQLLLMSDLTTQLIEFVQKKR